jgi:predicted protein tyrosine phosphatase
MNQVTFLPKDVASALTVPTNMISINSPNSYTQFACEHKRLLVLSFYPNDFGDLTHNIPTEETAKEIIDFIESCNGEDVVVHCGEGSIRSSAVALFMERDMDYELDTEFKGCKGSTANRSRNLYMLLRREHAARHPRLPHGE